MEPAELSRLINKDTNVGISYKNNVRKSNIVWDKRARKAQGLRRVMSIDGELAKLEERNLKETKRFLDYVRKLNISTILDYGCGIGRFTGPLQKAGYRVMGVDTSLEMLKIADATYPHIHFCYPHQISEDARFDLVFTYTVLQHIGDYEPVLRHMGKLSKRYILSVEEMSEKKSTEHVFMRTASCYFVKGFTLADVQKWGCHTLILQEKIC